MQVMLYCPGAMTSGHGFIYASRLAEELWKLGTDVVFFTEEGYLAQYRTYRAGESPPYAVLEVPVKRTFRDRSAFRHFGPLAPVVYGYARMRSEAFFVRYLVDVARKRGIEVLHFLDSPEPITLWRILWSARGSYKPRLVLSIHPANWGFRLGQGLLKSSYKSIARRFLHAITKSFPTVLTAHGQWIAKQLRAQLGNSVSIEIAPYGTEVPDENGMRRSEARRRLGLPDNARVFLAFGMIRHDKRLDLILKAFARVHSDNVYLVVAGKPIDLSPAYITKLIRETGAAGRCVAHLEYVPEHDIPVFFRSADFVVLAHASTFTGQSGPLHLACTYGVPVIASAVGDLQDFVSRTQVGILFPPEDEDALREAMRSVLAWPQAVYEAYQERLLEAARTYSWGRMAQVFRGIYDRLASSKVEG